MKKLTYEDFGDNIEAYLVWLFSLPTGDALVALEHRLNDGSWRRAPDAFLTRLGNLAFHGADEDALRRLTNLLVERICELDIGPEAHAILPAILQNTSARPEQAERIVTWFVERAGPGEASLGADIFHALYYRTQKHKELAPQGAWLRPTALLAKWLVLNGSAELRSRRRSSDALAVAWIIGNAFEDPALLTQTLRVIARNEEGIGRPNWPDGMIRLLAMVAATTDGQQGTFLDVMQSSKDSGGVELVELVLDPLDGWPVYPELQRHVVSLLAADMLPANALEGGWQAAYQMAFPEGLSLSFRSSDGVRAALRSLQFHAAFGHRGFDRPERKGPDLRRWAEAVASEHIRIHDMVGDEGAEQVSVDSLRSIPGRVSAVDLGVRDALLKSLPNVPREDGRFLVRAILEEGHDSGTVSAAVLTLPRRGTFSPRATEHDLTAVKRLLTRVLHYPWSGPVAGVDVAKLFRGARTIEVGSLPDEDKVRVQGEVVRVDRKSLEGCLSVPLDPESQRAIAVMYFVHEMVHVGQAIGDKSVVGKLRSVGFAGETNLMHIDLGADDAAARIVETVFPTWRLQWLKDLQGRSLSAFPATAQHSSAGRARKLLRFVGLRVDYLVRSMQIVPPATVASGYAFADFGPVGGAFVVLHSGPPFAHLGLADLSAADAKIIEDSVGPASAGIDKLDEVLRRLLSTACGKRAV